MNQLTNTVVMVSPNHFGFNPETASSNVFQHQVSDSETKVQEKALKEFENAVKVLENNGVRVLVLNSREDAITPDSIFPNNWFSHHSDGKLVIYPMLAPNRRAERQADRLEKLLRESGVPVSKVLDLTRDEEQGSFLEGTGSLVLDRESKVAFAMESVRTIKGEFNKWCQIMGYEGVLFKGYGSEGKSIYHTNMAMSIGEKYAVVCLESVKNPSERDLVSQKLLNLGKEVIEISLEQLYLYCGNLLQVLDSSGGKKIVMSKGAYQGFNSSQLVALKKYGEIITLDLPIIEEVGGGSARCMLAEVFLQP